MLCELMLFPNTRRGASPVAQIQHFKHLCLCVYVKPMKATHLSSYYVVETYAKCKVKSRQCQYLSPIIEELIFEKKILPISKVRTFLFAWRTACPWLRNWANDKKPTYCNCIVIAICRNCLRFNGIHVNTTKKKQNSQVFLAWVLGRV